MTDAAEAGERLALDACREVGELALGAAPHDPAALQRRDSRAVVAAVFEALQAVHEPAGHRIDADDPDDATHGRRSPLIPEDIVSPKNRNLP